MTNIGELVDYKVPHHVGFHEYIHSYLVEHPKHYYMVANRTYLYYLDRNLGLLEFHGDFVSLTHQEVVDYIVGSLEVVNDMIESEEEDDGSDISGHGDDGA